MVEHSSWVSRFVYPDYCVALERKCWLLAHHQASYIYAFTAVDWKLVKGFQDPFKDRSYISCAMTWLKRSHLSIQTLTAIHSSDDGHWTGIEINSFSSVSRETFNIIYDALLLIYFAQQHNAPCTIP